MAERLLLRPADRPRGCRGRLWAVVLGRAWRRWSFAGHGLRFFDCVFFVQGGEDQQAFADGRDELAVYCDRGGFYSLDNGYVMLDMFCGSRPRRCLTLHVGLLDLTMVRGWRLVGSCLDIYFAASKLFKCDIRIYEGWQYLLSVRES